MDREKLIKNLNRYSKTGNINDLAPILVEMNDEIERLKAFAKNVNTYGGKKVYRDLVDIGK